MTLQNLARIGQLKLHPPEASDIQRLLTAARRIIDDSNVVAISTETRFDVAYKAVMQAALAALMANGFRPDTKRPGHHMTVLQTLTKTVGLETNKLIVLDTLRRKRNLADYTGDDVDEVSVRLCIEEARSLLQHVEGWLEQTHPQLLTTK